MNVCIIFHLEHVFKRHGLRRLTHLIIPKKEPMHGHRIWNKISPLKKRWRKRSVSNVDRSWNLEGMSCRRQRKDHVVFFCFFILFFVYLPWNTHNHIDNKFNVCFSSVFLNFVFFYHFFFSCCLFVCCVIFSFEGVAFFVFLIHNSK